MEMEMEMENQISQDIKIEKEFGLKDLMEKFSPTYGYHCSKSIIPNQTFINKFIRIYLNTGIDESVELILNPVMIIELEEEENDFDLVFDISNVFVSIKLVNAGTYFDELYSHTYISILNKIYGLEIKKVGSKIFYPLPFECMCEANGLLAKHNFYLELKFGSGKHINLIKSLTIRTDTISPLSKPEYSTLNKQISNFFKNNYGNNYKPVFVDENNNQLIMTKIKQSQSNVLTLQNNPRIKSSVHFNHIVDRFFLYFVNSKDGLIYSNTQQFELIIFIANGYEVLEYDYETLINMNNKSVLRYELPKGVFEIKWNVPNYKNLSRIEKFQVELIGLMVPTDIQCVICAESVNFLGYNNNLCGCYFSN